MKRDMKQWVNEIIQSDHKKALPILSFPGVNLLHKTVKEVIYDSELYAEGLCKVSERSPMAHRQMRFHSGSLMQETILLQQILF